MDSEDVSPEILHVPIAPCTKDEAISGSNCTSADDVARVDDITGKTSNSTTAEGPETYGILSTADLADIEAIEEQCFNAGSYASASDEENSAESAASGVDMC